MNNKNQVTNAEETAKILPATPLANLTIDLQYVKDMSVRIPNTPQIYNAMPTQPHIIIIVDVKAQQLVENQPNFDVVVIITCVGTAEVPTEQVPTPPPIFTIKLQYAAVVSFPSLETSNMEALLMVHTPDLLFPEIRNIIINTTRASNLPAVLLQRIDFAGLWKEKKQQAIQDAT